MDTNKIRQLSDAACEVGPIRYSVQTTLHLALAEIADALDELDERTRGEGAKVVYERSPEVGVDEPSPSWTEKDTAPAPTIPGCYCRECKHAQFVDGGKYCRCTLLGSPGYAVVSGAMGFGCTLGERREAE